MDIFIQLLILLPIIIAGGSLIIINNHKGKINELKALNDIYKRYWEELCNQMLAEIEKDGYCRLVISEEKIKEMMCILKYK